MDSVLSQTRKDWELVVCDSYSTDGSWEFFQQFASDPRVRLYQVPKEGLYAGWNECLLRARGEFVHIAPADDWEEPDFLETLLAALESNPGAGLAYAGYSETDLEGTVIPKEAYHCFHFGPEDAGRKWSSARLLFAILMHPPWVTMSSVVLRRSLLDEVGLFPTGMYSRGDVGWASRALMRTEAVFVPKPLAYWRTWPGQASVNSPSLPVRLATWRFFRDMLRQETGRIPAEWTHVPHWRERLLAARLGELREVSGLYRGDFKRNPTLFLKRMAGWLRFDPSFVFAQAASGFDFQASKHAWNHERRWQHAGETAAAFGLGGLWSQLRDASSAG